MFTMKRCFSYLLIAASLWITNSVAQTSSQLSQPLPVQEVTAIDPTAPATRKFPATALRGMLKVVQTPEILIDGQPERLSPGSRIRDLSNRLVLSASITGQEFIVNFVRNPFGEVHEVWILSDAEIKQKITLNTPARNFRFASENEGPKQDDGKTPFRQLQTFDEIRKQQREQQRQTR
jgi:hypothetical protein